MNDSSNTPDNGLGDFQQKLQAWLFWDRQSSEFKLAHPEPPKPSKETTQ